MTLGEPLRLRVPPFGLHSLRSRRAMPFGAASRSLHHPPPCFARRRVVSLLSLSLALPSAARKAQSFYSYFASKYKKTMLLRLPSVLFALPPMLFLLASSARGIVAEPPACAAGAKGDGADSPTRASNAKRCAAKRLAQIIIIY